MTTMLITVTLYTLLPLDIQTTGGRKLFIQRFNEPPYKTLVNPPANLHLGFKCVPIQRGKNLNFLLLTELSYFRQIVAKMAEDRTVKQCDSLPPSSIALYYFQN